MNTIPCTVEEFNKAFCEFNTAIGDKSNTQEGISNMHKCLVLHYLGIKGDQDIERSAMVIDMATQGALMRGWCLDPPDLTGME